MTRQQIFQRCHVHVQPIGGFKVCLFFFSPTANHMYDAIMKKVK